MTTISEISSFLGRKNKLQRNYLMNSRTEAHTGQETWDIGPVSTQTRDEMGPREAI